MVYIINKPVDILLQPPLLAIRCACRIRFMGPYRWIGPGEIPVPPFMISSEKKLQCGFSLIYYILILPLTRMKLWRNNITPKKPKTRNEERAAVIP